MERGTGHLRARHGTPNRARHLRRSRHDGLLPGLVRARQRPGPIRNGLRTSRPRAALRLTSLLDTLSHNGLRAGFVRERVLRERVLRERVLRERVLRKRLRARLAHHGLRPGVVRHRLTSFVRGGLLAGLVRARQVAELASCGVRVALGLAGLLNALVRGGLLQGRLRACLAHHRLWPRLGRRRLGPSPVLAHLVRAGKVRDRLLSGRPHLALVRGGLVRG
ncbi:hypothetical protein LV75_006571 [Actinokineospora diospyrosa]|uniref:Uncharacterized protein n=2 Tax=Actinokineospora diospyrosa TaxID=103728 RepID=A0ABT1INC6_9PSEU|nr:hypothetical protein [Actinokineospora diospyrosa]